MSAASYSRILGANDNIRLGVIGCGGRGCAVMECFQKSPNVRVTALCDIYDERIAEARKSAPEARGYVDHREILGQKDIDVVLIATPDHWHAQIAIDAAKAGKDLYIEKPLTRTIEEGSRVVDAVRANNRICQVGLQQRSGEHYLRAKEEYFKTGKLGKITMARTYWLGEAFHLRKAPASLQRKPAGLDWKRYLGPVAWREWDPQQYYNFRAYLDFGGGQITDLFTHWIDVVHMMMGQDNPVSAVAAGGIYHYKDGRTAPDTISVLLEYPGEWTATFDGTLAPGVTGRAVEIWGTEGRLRIDRKSCEFYAGNGNAKPVTFQNTEGDATLKHVNNFLESVRSRRLPVADVAIGSRSTQAALLGNVAYLRKRRIRFDPDRGVVLPS